jgi:hypothetical protein
MTGFPLFHTPSPFKTAFADNEIRESYYQDNDHTGFAQCFIIKFIDNEYRGQFVLSSSLIMNLVPFPII